MRGGPLTRHTAVSAIAKHHTCRPWFISANISAAPAACPPAPAQVALALPVPRTIRTKMALALPMPHGHYSGRANDSLSVDGGSCPPDPDIHRLSDLPDRTIGQSRLDDGRVMAARTDCCIRPVAACAIISFTDRINQVVVGRNERGESPGVGIFGGVPTPSALVAGHIPRRAAQASGNGIPTVPGVHSGAQFALGYRHRIRRAVVQGRHALPQCSF